MQVTRAQEISVIPPQRSQFYESVVIGAVATAGVLVALRGSFEETTQSDAGDDNDDDDDERSPGGKDLGSLFTIDGKDGLNAVRIPSYKEVRDPLQIVFRVVGQMLVAPIVYKYGYQAYVKYCEQQQVTF